MKARLLKKLLNNTGYSISNHENYIAVGSPLCHDLISVNKKTLKVKYALDTFNKGRDSVGNKELEFIWDKIHELIETGEIKDIIENKDVIENPLPIFWADDGVIMESVTDKYGWPNTDADGNCMYDNTHFPTKEQAIESGINDMRYAIESVTETIERLEKELKEKKERLLEYESKKVNLENIGN